MLLGSFKTDGEILRNPSGFLPEEPTLANYATWFTDLNISMFFVNSLIVAVVTVLGNLVFCSMIGYALAKMDFAGKRVLFLLVMLTLMVPGVVTFVPLFVLVTKMGLLNTYPALILPFLTSPLGVFLMRQFMMGIPDSLIEAARIDGAGEFRIFARVVMPLCGPPLATLGHPDLPRLLEQLPVATGRRSERGDVHPAGDAGAVLHRGERHEVRSAARRIGAGDHPDRVAVRAAAAVLHPERCHRRRQMS